VTRVLMKIDTCDEPDLSAREFIVEGAPLLMIGTGLDSGTKKDLFQIGFVT
jgi:hypothetical protein